MKRIITIFCFIFLLISQVGYYFIFVYQQYQIKEEVKQQMLSNLPEAIFDIVIADENNSNFLWEEEGKEFTLNGELYDVAKIKVNDGKTILYAVKDTKEDLLLQQLVKNVKTSSDNKSNGKTSKHVVKFQVNELFETTIERKEMSFQIIDNIYVAFTSAIITSSTEIISPPPRM